MHDYDAEQAAFDEIEDRREFDREVQREARRVRIRESATALVRAEKTAHVDYDSLFLDREELRDLPEPDPLIEGILARECYAIVRGRDQSFKSFVALDWGACIATGKPWQGRHVEHGRVLYIAGEGASGISKRLDAWETGWATAVDRGMFVTRKVALDMHNPGPAFDHLLAHVAMGRYVLVIIDTLRRVSGRADGNTSEMGAVIDNIERIKQATANGSVLVISHTDKNDKDSRGYSGIEDDADIVWSTKRDEMRLTLELKKNKDGPDGQTMRLEAIPTMRSLTLGEASDNTSEVSNANQLLVLEVLRTTYRDGASPTALIEATGIVKASLYRACNALEDAGHIVNTGTKRSKYFEIPPMPETESHGDHEDTPLGEVS